MTQQLDRDTASTSVAESVAGQTLTTAFRDTVRRRGDAVALRWTDAGGERSMSWREYGEQACALAAGLRQLGLGRGDRLLMMLRNRPEFHLTDTAAMLLGATPISVYNSSSAEQVAYLAGHAKAKVAVVEQGLAASLLAVRDRLPHLEQVVVVDGDTQAGGGEGGRGGEGDLVPFATLTEHPPVDLDEAAAAARPEDLATVIYTSGTTGNPKGVMLTHATIRFAVASFQRRTQLDGTGMRLVSYLPMAHVAERALSQYGHLVQGSDVTCVPDPSQLLAVLPKVRPQLLFGPPRVWEKLQAGLSAAMGGDPEKKAALEQTLAVGQRRAELRERGEADPEVDEQWAALDAAVAAPVRALVGLDDCQAVITGAAPVPVGVVRFFLGLGLPFTEVYGLSETCGGATYDRDLARAGTVGRALPDVDVRLADDGEVLIRGGLVFSGYLDDPERTAEALDLDGWMHTGDIGVLDADGFVTIVDRKKELIITAGGKNISPANLEAALKTVPLVGQAIAVGDGRPYLVALLTLDPDVAPVWARGQGLDGLSLPELAAHPAVLAEVGRGVDAANDRFSHVEKIKRWRLLGEEWQPDTDVLTPTMKLKRRGVLARYEQEIEALYGG